MVNPADQWYYIPIFAKVSQMLRRVFFYLFLIHASICVQAQVKPGQPGSTPDSKKGEEIKIIHSEFTYIESSPGMELKILQGDVQLFHDSTFLYCDSARLVGLLVMAYGNVVIRQNDTVQIFADSLRYDGQNKTADLYGEVVLINGGQSLYTKRLHYDMNTSIASYNTPATLKSNTTTLKSKRGYYHTKDQMAYFAGQVQMADPEIQLRSDSLQFHTGTHTATFVAPTLMEKNKRKIYCEAGYYDVDDKMAEFAGNPQFEEEDKKSSAKVMRYDGNRNEINLYQNVKYVSADNKLQGDTLLYNEKTKEMTLLGKGEVITKDGTVNSSTKLIYNDSSGVFTTVGRSMLNDSTNSLVADQIFRDGVSGNLIAVGKVIWIDTANAATIDCDSMHLSKKSNKVVATSSNGRQPLFKSFDNTEDTLYVKADTLIVFESDTISKTKNVQAYYRVQVYRSDIQAVSDSLTYNTEDSIFTLYKNPIIWSDTSQFFADTIRIKQNENHIDKIYLNQNALIINSEDLKYFNQIKGRNITASFDSTNLSVVEVSGNAEAVYYIKDDAKAYIGVNKIICSNIKIRFGNNQIDRIYFITKPDGAMHPMRTVDHEALKLEGFRWEYKNKPSKLSILGLQKDGM